MIQVPDEFLRAVVDFELPEAGAYATGLVFLPTNANMADRAVAVLSKYAVVEGAQILGWRDLPIYPTGLGDSALAALPRIRQVFLSARRLHDNVVGPAGAPLQGLELERAMYCMRKQTERETRDRGVAIHFPSLSARTICYKGMLTAGQLATCFPDLDDPRTVSAIAIASVSFGATMPSWSSGQPHRYTAYNGEISTIQGNRNRMAAREALLRSHLIPGDLRRVFPVCTPEATGSASFDEVLELLHLCGRSLAHAALMMIPEAWENDDAMDPQRRDFYRFHSCLMEPWDGPASVAFTDGTVVGAVLDRNGLRPGRWWRTRDGLVALASEAGVLDVDPSEVVAKGRLQPGRMFLVDTAAGRVIEDDEIKKELAGAAPYGDWLHAGLMYLEELPEREHIVFTHESVMRRQKRFGYTEEELTVLLAPMAKTGAEPVGSMGADTPIAVLSKRPRLLYDYFVQLFAQVTTPPLDAIREEQVTSVSSTIGPEANLLDPDPASCRRIVLPFPVIDNDELAKILSIDEDGNLPGFRAVRVSGLYRVADGGEGLRSRLVEICRGVSEAIEDGVRILVLSDRDSTVDLAPVPSLLLTAVVHQHLVREQTRTQVGLIVESGDCREAHHAAALLGFGAAAVNPYLAFESVEDLISTGALSDIAPAKAVRNYIMALGKGILRIMSKMGVSTVASYTGAQPFETVGLHHGLVERYFTGTPSSIAGIGLTEIGAEIEARHAAAYDNPQSYLDIGGDWEYAREGELHLFNPETVFLLQHATRSRRYDIFKQYTSAVDRLTAGVGALRGLFELRTAVSDPVPIEEVEPASEIVKRFGTGAMSFGSISAEAHETLAIAMNRLGAKSNTGEGGEDRERLHDPLRRSAVKQVASGRFGVTTAYLVHADDLQIKMAQGATPGEGGHLPGNKVWPWIARTRRTTPGIGLISPPQHHDVYSIEDLAQLVHDLKNVNPSARIQVKLASTTGVGTVAAGVVKAKADVILISGHDGGTGASPLSSLKHAGTPWELGLAETQQTLLLYGLRDRVTVQVDGQLKTGRDVVLAALLGAEEFGFATAPLITAGCVMMRACHLDTCPVGIATQNPVLRKRFSGEPEFVADFFLFLAQEVREYLAALGLRSLDEAIGRVELLDWRPPADHGKASGLDMSPVLHLSAVDWPRRRTRGQDHRLERVLDNALIEQAWPALDRGEAVRIETTIHNEHRSVGAMLGGEVVRRHGDDGLAEGTIDITLRGSAGQSFGAFVPRGVILRLFGDANDYVAKGLSGGRLVIRPDEEALGAEEDVIAGNSILYGATSGELYIRGRVGERFAVRNSGASAVVEGVGDHACESMTDGAVVVLGPVGRNFAAGMSGGVAYVWRLSRDRVNPELVDLTNLSTEDADLVRSLLARHGEATGSATAATLLEKWPAALAEFTTVIPRSYQRAKRVIRDAEAAGREIDDTLMAELITAEI
jgi:glutamate synthase (NADPH/NADH) large chain